MLEEEEERNEEEGEEERNEEEGEEERNEEEGEEGEEERNEEEGEEGEEERNEEEEPEGEDEEQKSVLRGRLRLRTEYRDLIHEVGGTFVRVGPTPFLNNHQQPRAYRGQRRDDSTKLSCAG